MFSFTFRPRPAYRKWVYATTGARLGKRVFRRVTPQLL